VHEKRGAIGVKIVGYPPASTNEHGGGRIGRDVNENALLLLVIRHSTGTRLGDPRGT
jgi:hypothetical protein